MINSYVLLFSLVGAPSKSLISQKELHYRLIVYNKRKALLIIICNVMDIALKPVQQSIDVYNIKRKKKKFNKAYQKKKNELIIYFAQLRHHQENTNFFRHLRIGDGLHLNKGAVVQL